MALDVLLHAIAQNGESEARQIIEDARAEATAIRAAADARVQRRIADSGATREAELRAALDARRARARHEARVHVLRVRSQFMDRIFHAADAALPGILDQAAAHETLTTLCREALDFFPLGGARIRCRGTLARTIAEVLPRAAIVVDDGVPEGVIVESNDGRARIDNTLAARLQRLRPALSIAITNTMSSSA